MSHTNDSINGIVKTLTDKIYEKLNQDTNPSMLVIDTNELSDEHKQKLIEYADDKGIINVANLVDNSIFHLFLEISAANGRLDIVKFLVESGAEINGTNALYYSTGNGHLEVVKFLVESGAKINAAALYNSARNGHLEVVKFLVGAEAKMMYATTFALYNCSLNGHLDIVKFLVESGAKINDPNALSYSAFNGHLPVVKFLVESGVKINDTWALYHSALNGHLEVVKFLIEKGATINDTMALTDSARKGHLEVVKFLVRKYIETNIPIPDKCITKEENNINRFLFMYASEDKHHLFNDKIVSELESVKNLLK